MKLIGVRVSISLRTDAEVNDVLGIGVKFSAVR
jgi:hypothetical protein